MPRLTLSLPENVINLTAQPPCGAIWSLSDHHTETCSGEHIHTHMRVYIPTHIHTPQHTRKSCTNSPVDTHLHVHSSPDIDTDTHTVTLNYTHTHCHSLTHMVTTHTYTLKHNHTHIHTHCLTHTHSQTHIHTVSHRHSYTHTHTRSGTHTPQGRSCLTLGPTHLLYSSCPPHTCGLALG